MFAPALRHGRGLGQKARSIRGALMIAAVKVRLEPRVGLTEIVELAGEEEIIDYGRR
jgi:hypothetical protein